MRRLALIFILIAILVPLRYSFATDATDQAALQAQIDAKKQQLDSINQQLDSTKANLQGVQQQKQALQKEIATLEGSMKELNLSMQSDQVTIQELGLEINSLNYSLSDIKSAIATKQQGIQDTFKEIQRAEGDSMLIVFLRQDSLEGAITEVQSLASLGNQLTKEVNDLNTLHDQYTNTIGDITGKKSSIQVHTLNLQNRKLIVQDQKQTQLALLSQTKNQESVYQSKLTELQKQQVALEDEVSQIENQLRANFNVNVLPTQRKGILSWPIMDGAGIITTHFGEIVRGLYSSKNPHNGLDIGVPIGTPVVAAADGVVMAVDNNDVSLTSKYQYGKYILIKHPNNLATLYGHLSRQIVTAGQTVKKGDIIGYSGATGRATGPHLHLGLYWAPSIQLRAIAPARGLVPVGVILNPEDYL